jgi:hypothetical protein
MLIVRDDDYGITRASLATWRDNRKLFGRFIEARIYSLSDGALIDGRYCHWDEDVIDPHPPSTVLIDEQGNELWLSGTSCGYSGEGPSGAERILREELFGDAAETVFKRDVVRVILRKYQDGKITSELTQRDQTLWDGRGDITRWLQQQGERLAGTDRATEVDRLRWG